MGILKTIPLSLFLSLVKNLASRKDAESAVLAGPTLGGRTTSRESAGRGVADFRRHKMLAFGGHFRRPLLSSGRPSPEMTTKTSKERI